MFRWFCTACDHINIGASFPLCALCGNTKSGDGQDGETALKQNYQKVHHRLQMFLYRDGAERNQDEYVIKDR